VLTRIIMVLLRENEGGQGRHIDPEDPATQPPRTDRWTAAQRAANQSPSMGLFADALPPPGGGSARDGVLGDLAEYHRLGAAEVVERCLRWEEDSVEEWQAGSRDTAAGLAEFYNSVESWSFDLLWYAYLQSLGYGYPQSVIVADRVGPAAPGARMLDLGSGSGVTAQLFASLGYEVTLADVSAPLLAFARWRLEKRGVPATYLHLPADLPEASFDLVTAVDVMAHVPDATATARELHRALRPGGLFAANFDVRRRSARNAWHLYEDDLPLRWAVERVGFTPVGLIDGIVWMYQARPTTGLGWRLRHAVTWIRLASPPARALRSVRRALARAALVTVLRVRGRNSDDGSDGAEG
jgi:SAM-dependent methyltransferase